MSTLSSRSITKRKKDIKLNILVQSLSDYDSDDDQDYQPIHIEYDDNNGYEEEEDIIEEDDDEEDDNYDENKDEEEENQDKLKKENKLSFGSHYCNKKEDPSTEKKKLKDKSDQKGTNRQQIINSHKKSNENTSKNVNPKRKLSRMDVKDETHDFEGVEAKDDIESTTRPLRKRRLSNINKIKKEEDQDCDIIVKKEDAQPHLASDLIKKESKKNFSATHLNLETKVEMVFAHVSVLKEKMQVLKRKVDEKRKKIQHIRRKTMIASENVSHLNRNIVLTLSEALYKIETRSPHQKHGSQDRKAVQEKPNNNGGRVDNQNDSDESEDIFDSVTTENVRSFLENAINKLQF